MSEGRAAVADVVLVALNARWTHASLGLRYLHANLGDLAPRAVIKEFDVARTPLEVAAEILRLEPKVVGLGVYVWNARAAGDLAALLKRLAPEVRLVVGGPEVSYELDGLEVADLADHVVRGEADLAFRDLCRALLDGGPPPPKLIDAPLPALDAVALPYDLYDATDLRSRTLYVEASRGCPYTCEFCLSALDVPVRRFPLEAFLAALERLHDRGARRFKFVDRTFNLDLRVAEAILAFFLERPSPDLFLHFEMIPDRLPEDLRATIRRFPPGVLQFEVGVQTLSAEVAARVGRRQDVGRLEANFRFLREETGVHVHADLIVGLPGEDLATFAAGFDRLAALGPQEIQVGILKRLRGAPIARHDARGMVYDPHPPYEVLRSDAIDFETMLRLKAFAATWDRVANGGDFVETLALVTGGGSAFAGFLALSDRLRADAGPESARRGVALSRLVEIVFDHLVRDRGLDPRVVAPMLLRDYQRGGRTDRPPRLRPHLPDPSVTRDPRPAEARAVRAGLERQDRRTAGAVAESSRAASAPGAPTDKLAP